MNILNDILSPQTPRDGSNTSGDSGTPNPRAVVIPDKPIMGLLLETSKGWVAVTGGIPKLDWTGLEPISLLNQDFKTEPLRFRAQDNSTATKTFMEREAGLSSILKLGDDIHEFAKDMRIKLEQHGMDTIAYVPDPFIKNKMSYVLEDYPKFQADKNIREQVELISDYYDTYDRSNSKNAAKCLLNSLEKSLRQRVVSRLRDTDIYFPVVWMKVVSEFITYTPLRWESIRNQIKARHPKQYPGEDIGLLCDAYDKDAKELTVAGQYDHQLTRNMIEAILKSTSGDDSFRHEMRELLVRLKKTLDECHFMDQFAKDSYLSTRYMGYLDVTELARKLYLDARANNNWLCAGSVLDSKTPQGYRFSGRPSANMAGLKPNFRGNDGNKGAFNRDKSKDKCAICGKLGHWAKDCKMKNYKNTPHLKANNANFQVRNKGASNWKYVPPTPGQNPTIRHMGANFQWCAKCRRWTKTHNTETHGHLTGAALPNPNQDQTTIRASILRDMENPDFTPAAWNIRLKPLPKMEKTFKLENEFQKYTLPLAGLIFGLLLTSKFTTTTVWSSVTPIVWLIVTLILKRIIYDDLQTRKSARNYLNHQDPEPQKRNHGPDIKKHDDYGDNIAKIISDHYMAQEIQNLNGIFKNCNGKKGKNGKKKNKKNKNPYAIHTKKMCFQPKKEVQNEMRGSREAMHKSRENLKDTLLSELDGKEDYVKTVEWDNVKKFLRPKYSPAPADMNSAFILPKEDKDPDPPGMTVIPKKEESEGKQESLKSIRLLVSMIKIDTMTDWPENVSAWQNSSNKLNNKNDSNKKQNIKEPKEYPVIWDSGASHTMTFDKNDFQGDLTPCSRKLSGIGNDDFDISGYGIVKWRLKDINGKYRTLELPSYYVPQANVRLLSTSHLLQIYQDEHITLHQDHLLLSGSTKDSKRGAIKVHINPSDNLPTSLVFDDVSNPRANMSIINEVSNHNINLQLPEKELLRWHCKLGHMGFNKIKYIMKSGGLTKNSHLRNVHMKISKTNDCPKCAACLYGNQVRRSDPGKIHSQDVNKQNVLKKEDLLPGQTISVDHFIIRTPGRLIEGNGQKKISGDMYSGGCIFVDHASGYIHIILQAHMNTHETLAAKISFEEMCTQHGVVPLKYLTDNGTAFLSEEFVESLKEFQQHTIRGAPGAHHHNGIAERNIRTIMTIARTMLIHRSIHWPEVSTTILWPLAVLHAQYLFNHMPNPKLGFSPYELFTRTKIDHGDFNHLHVWGCPVYVLSPSILNGVKLPRWVPRSERFAYMGVADTHSKTSPLVLNLSTGRITTKWSVVFDDWFATVASTPDEIPNFESDEWHDIFGDYFINHDLDENEIEDITETIPSAAVLDHRDRVVERIEKQHQNNSTPANTEIAHNYENLDAHFYDDPVPELRDPQILLPVQQEKSPAINAQSPTTFTMQQNESTTTIPPTPTTFKNNTQQNSIINIESPPKPKIVKFEDPLPAKNAQLPTILRRSSRERKQNEVLNYDKHGGPKQHGSHFSSLQPFYDDNGANNFHDLRCNKISENKDPDIFTFDEAMNSEHKQKWIDAMMLEVKQIEEADTWIEVPISEVLEKIIPGTWVLRIKRSPDGEIKKFKARFCVRGDLQDGVNETYAPVVQWSSVRIFLILTLHLGWTTCSIDFSNAFVQAKLEKPVWIHVPRGYHAAKPGTCLKLIKSLYGLTIAPRLWYQHLFKGLIAAGFTQCKEDSCLLYKTNMIIVVYVDDLGVGAANKEDIDILVKDLENQGFALTREGSFSEFLGIKFNKLDNGDIECTQKGLIQKILKTANMTDCNPNHTPTLTTSLGKHPEAPSMKEEWSYRSIVGMLLYLSTNTRPDITFAVSQVARFSHDPKVPHATAVKSILRYLAGTMNRGTIVKMSQEMNLECFVDADFAGLFKADPMVEATSAKSRSGYIIRFAGTPLIWKSKLQTRTALSTLEAEYIALSASLRAMIPLRRIILELAKAVPTIPQDFEAKFDCKLFEDNSGAFLLATNHQLTTRTKYFHVELHHFWENMNDGELKIFKIASLEQLADYFTKPLSRYLFEANRKKVQGF